MKIIHTSDWHLGHRLLREERTDEHARFLEWLTELIADERPDALIISGDVFDTYNPPLASQRLYFDFLQGIQGMCRTVVTAGNHDSGALIDTTSGLLERIGVCAVGEMREPEEEVTEIKDADGETLAVCCAVPFLRSYDLVQSVAGKTPEERKNLWEEAFHAHYARAAEAAEKLRAGRDIPLIATGHCYVLPENGGESTVGMIDGVGAGAFPDCIDYLALGHIHSCGACGGKENFRYSGSPLCTSFETAEQRKCVLVVTFDGKALEAVREIEVPRFRKIVRLEGSLDSIEERMAELLSQGDEALVDIHCTDAVNADEIRARIAVPDGAAVKVLRSRAPNAPGRAPYRVYDAEEWTPRQVFDRILEDKGITGAEADGLRQTYIESLEAAERGTKAEDVADSIVEECYETVQTEI